MIANEPTKAGHLSLCAQSTFLILVEKHTMLCFCPRQPDYLMRGGGPRTWRTRANPFESVWPQVQRWLKEHPEAIAKDLVCAFAGKHARRFPSRATANSPTPSQTVAKCNRTPVGRSVLTLRQ